MDNKIDAGLTKPIMRTDMAEDPYEAMAQRVDLTPNSGSPKPLSKKERDLRKKRRKIAQKSKRQNRK